MRKVLVTEHVVGTQIWEVEIPDSAPESGMDLLRWFLNNQPEYLQMIDSNLDITDLTIKEKNNG